MILPCLTLSNIRYVSRLKWSNPGKRIAPSPTPRRCSYWKGSLLVTLDYSHQLYLYTGQILSRNPPDSFQKCLLNFFLFIFLKPSYLCYLLTFDKLSSMDFENSCVLRQTRDCENATWTVWEEMCGRQKIYNDRSFRPQRSVGFDSQQNRHITPFWALAGVVVNPGLRTDFFISLP